MNNALSAAVSDGPSAGVVPARVALGAAVSDGPHVGGLPSATARP